MSISYLNGCWQAVEKAQVSVLDRGFLFGDGVYESIPVYAQRPFQLARHLQRLRHSLAEIYLPDPYSQAQWHELIAEAIEKSGESNASLYIQITRGADNGRSFDYPDGMIPTVFMLVSAAPALARQSVKPYAMITLEDFRWSRCDIKTISLVAAGMLKNQAVAKGADDAVLVRDGYITECTSANIFVVKNGIIFTPPKSQLLLHGITRAVIIELARENNVPLQEVQIDLDTLAHADEIFVASSTREAWPVGWLNGKPVGAGCEPDGTIKKPAGGCVWRRIDALFQLSKTRDFQV
ncbi:MAG: aminotransferase class IV [Pseudomonadales bacterium]|nr:aminotransferase class IV [Pseudomonadales bacterium]